MTKRKNKHNKRGEGAPSTPSAPTPQVVVNQIVVKQPNRKVWDIGSWRSALKSADRGKVTALFDLFEDILIDGTLADALDKRIKAVNNTPLTFVDADSEEVTEITDLIDCLDWEEVITQIMLCRFWGRSAFELGFGETHLSCFPIPAAHISLRTKSILIDASDEIGRGYEDDPFLLVLGKERDYGLLLRAAPFVIYKRGGFGDWAQWIELFGMPQRIGKYNIHDPESKRHLEEAFERAGSAPYVICPSGTEIESVETSSGNGSAYDDFRRACNEEILITILGQTMTTVQGDKGARSLGEVHMQVEESKHKSDLRYVQRVLNQYLVPRLAARGYPVDGGRFVFPESAEHLEVAEIVQLSDIIEIPAKWIHHKYAIPIPEDGEAIARRTPAPSPYMIEEVEEEQEPQKEDEKKPIRNSDGLLRRIRRFFGLAPSTTTLGAYQTTCRPTGTPLTLADATSIDDALIERIALASGKAVFDPALFQWLSNDLIKALHQGFKRSVQNSDIPLALQYDLQDDALITAMEANLFRFSAGKTLSEVYELNRAFRASRNYSDFAQRAKAITGKYNNRWQQAEYNTALNCAQAASNFTELKRKAKLFPYWEYRTIGDSKVRAEHEALNGVILPYNSSKWDEIYPPNGWGCRCSVVPRMAHEVEGKVDLVSMLQQIDDYQQTSEWQSAKAQGWGVNRATSAEVFDANQQYVHKLPTHASRDIDKLHAQHYGQPSVSKMMERAEDVAPVTELDERTIWQEVAKGDDKLILSDYRGRKIVLEEQNFIEHTTKKSDNRIAHWDAMLETLSDPTEVWIHRERAGVTAPAYKRRRLGKIQKGDEKKISQNDIALIRYYQDKAIVVNVRIEQECLVLRTWYELALKKDVVDSKRRGLLVHSKKG